MLARAGPPGQLTAGRVPRGPGAPMVRRSYIDRVRPAWVVNPTQTEWLQRSSSIPAPDRGSQSWDIAIVRNAGTVTPICLPENSLRFTQARFDPDTTPRFQVVVYYLSLSFSLWPIRVELAVPFAASETRVPLRRQSHPGTGGIPRRLSQPSIGSPCYLLTNCGDA